MKSRPIRPHFETDRLTDRDRIRERERLRQRETETATQRDKTDRDRQINQAEATNLVNVRSK